MLNFYYHKIWVKEKKCEYTAQLRCVSPSLYIKGIPLFNCHFILFPFYSYIYILFYYFKNIWGKIFVILWEDLILYLKRYNTIFNFFFFKFKTKQAKWDLSRSIPTSFSFIFFYPIKHLFVFCFHIQNSKYEKS